MNMVHEFHGEHRRLPNSLAELACRASDPCDYRKHGGRFYASYGDDWIAVEPIIVLDEADFNCWSTVLPLYDPHFQKCTRLEADDIPEIG